MEKIRFNAVKLNGQTLQKCQHGVLVGMSSEKEMKMNILGSPSLEQCLDMLMTAQLQILNDFLTLATQKITDPNVIKQVQEDIYKRANIGAGLMLDEFYPEGKDSKFGTLTDAAIMKAQNEILLRK